MNMKDNANVWKHYSMKIAFIASMCFLLFAITIFKVRRVLPFLAIHFALFAVIVLRKNAKLPMLFSDKKSTVLASFYAIIVFGDFYINAIDIKPRMLVRIAGIIGKIVPVSYECFVTISSFCLAVLCLYALYILAELSLRNSGVLLKVARIYRNHIITLFLVYLFAFLAVMRANYYYIDDIGRAIHGNGLTGGFSRHLSDILAEILHVNVWLADISPITQIVALLILSYTGAVILYIVHGDNVPQLWHVVALIPMGLSPYFLACLSFKYDAPYMAFSILASIIPLLYCKKSGWRYGVVVYIAILCMCTTYQASSGIFPACVLLIALLMWIKDYPLKQIVRFVGISALGYMTALISFRYILMTPSLDSYVDTSISIEQIIPNIGKYFQLLWNDYNAIWKLCVFLIAAVFFVCSVVITKRSRFATAVMLFVALFGILVLTYGVNCVFKTPTTDARGIYAIGVMISVISVLTLSMDTKCISVSAIVLLSWLCIVFSSVYGNALDLQKDYTAYRMEQVLDDINEERLIETGHRELRFAGSEGVSNAVKSAMREYPMLQRLMPILFDDHQGYYWGPKQFWGFYEENLNQVQINFGNNYDLQAYILIKETTNYAIYSKGDELLIYFNN